MLEAMRIQALDFLFQKIDESGSPPDDMGKWYLKTKENNPKEIFPYLVESAGKIDKVYIIEKEQGKECAELHVEDMRPEIEPFLVFVKPTGSQSAQIGPVIKRSYNKQKGAGPSAKILNTTMKSFQEVADEDKLWSAYFKNIVSILSFESIILTDGSVCNWNLEGYDSMLECVIDKIGPAKGPVFVTVRNEAGELPGDNSSYVNYLTTEILAGDRYLTGKIKAVPGLICPLCNQEDKIVFPNALKGAGINLTNVDRAGRFPGMLTVNAWKSFPLCSDCADLLYIYKNYVLKKVGPKKDIQPYTSQIAGEKALIIPYCTTDTKTRLSVWEDVRNYVDKAKNDVGYEEYVLDNLLDKKGLLNLTFMWCKIGQSLEEVSGIITDVLPSRLSFLSEENDKARQWKHPVFPKKLLKNEKNGQSLEPNLALSALRSLFYRPGGKKAPNATRRLSELRRRLAAAVYHGRKIPQRRLWDEILTTAQWWWLDAIERNDVFGLMNKGKGKKGKGDYLTAAGWIRHLAWWLYYLKHLEVLEMGNDFYEPELELLKPFMGKESGIDKKEKAFAFLLGVVYGRLIFIQETSKVRVSVLNWVKRFNIDGKGLPDLYRKVRAKLLEYQQVPDEKTKRLFTINLHSTIEELSLIGSGLGDEINLSTSKTCYYLLLGLSLSNKILKKGEK